MTSTPRIKWRRLRVFRKSKLAVGGAILIAAFIIMAIFAPYFAPYNPITQDLRNRLTSSSAQHLLGTDIFGRDILSRIMYGSRISLTIAFTSVLISAFLGTLLGVLAGYKRGMLEMIIMRTADLFLALPAVLLGLVVAVTLGAGVQNIIAAITIAMLPRFIRLAHGPSLALREKDFVQSARSIGASEYRVMMAHIVPGILPNVLVMATLWTGVAIRLESVLGFLGLGISPPTPDWGRMLKNGLDVLLVAPAECIFTGLAVMLTILALNMLGDALRDLLDPRLQTL